MNAAINDYPPGGLRVSDAERDQAVAELSVHFQHGRLTQDEFEERTGRALKARTGAELADLFTDLPRGQVPPAGPVPPNFGPPSFGPPSFGPPSFGPPGFRPAALSRIGTVRILAAVAIVAVIAGGVAHPALIVVAVVLVLLVVRRLSHHGQQAGPFGGRPGRFGGSAGAAPRWSDRHGYMNGHGPDAGAGTGYGR
jgi:hypothetical protein